MAFLEVFGFSYSVTHKPPRSSAYKITKQHPVTPEKKEKRMNTSLMLSPLLASSLDAQTRRGPADRRRTWLKMSDCEEEQRQQITSLSPCPNIPHSSRAHLASCCWPRPIFCGNCPTTEISKTRQTQAMNCAKRALGKKIF